ncbi:hypothetical protein GPALN_002253 [Globodera pallida]|nr:hypothetical protein GPALN_002253 [Globodera pallida]
MQQEPRIHKRILHVETMQIAKAIGQDGRALGRDGPQQQRRCIDSRNNLDRGRTSSPDGWDCGNLSFLVSTFMMKT